MKGNACKQFLAPMYACAPARSIAGDAKKFRVTATLVALHQVRPSAGACGSSLINSTCVICSGDV